MSMMRAALLAAGGSSGPAITPVWSTNPLSNCRVMTNGSNGTGYCGLMMGSTALNTLDQRAGSAALEASGGSATFLTLIEALQVTAADYEVMANVVGSTGNHNFASVGRAINVWHGLELFKQNAHPNFNGGFVWSCSGVRAGTILVNVSVRHKIDTWRVTTRQFVVEQYTDVAPPTFSSFIDGASLDRTLLLSQDTSSFNALYFYTNGTSTLYGSANLNDNTYTATGNILANMAGWNGSNHEIKYTMEIIAGSGAFPVGPAGNIMGINTWYTIDSTRQINIQFTSGYCKVRVTVDIRNKTYTNLTDQAIFEWTVAFV